MNLKLHDKRRHMNSGQINSGSSLLAICIYKKLIDEIF